MNLLTNLVFGNPLGWWALLGLIWILVVHALQFVSKRERISTLFLLQRLDLESKQGARVIWVQQSLPFWLQILAILFLTWLLLDPRWQHRDEVQQVVVVFDSTLSVGAFRDDFATEVKAPLLQIAALAPHTYWTVLCTDPNLPTIYRGTDFSTWWSKLADWHPTLSIHDPTHVLEFARTAAAQNALVVFVTDRIRPVPTGVDLLAIGKKIENCAILGMHLDEGTSTNAPVTWQLLVKNFGQQPANPSWWMESGGAKTAPSPLALAPDQSTILKGEFPKDQDKLEICLSTDPFDLDDRLPVVRPSPKHLSVALQGDDQTTDLFVKLTQSLPQLGISTDSTPPDLTLSTTNPRRPIPNTSSGTIVLLNDPLAPKGLYGAPYVAANDPLIQDLNWQGLIFQASLEIPPLPTDQVLLWKDQKRLIFVRTEPSGQRELIFNFHFPDSNASRLPAFVLLLRRFVETIRDAKVAPESRNFEVAQVFHLAIPHPDQPTNMTFPNGHTETLSPRTEFQAPQLPGFFSISQDGVKLIDGAARLDDARLSDFSKAASVNTLINRKTQLLEMHADREPYTPLWLLLVLAMILLNWYWLDPKAPRTESAA